ncbi:response regulator transcription factor [Salinibacillus kushneri]|nr:response regulator transcription factor [Salinibacillus kushneri]
MPISLIERKEGMMTTNFNSQMNEVYLKGLKLVQQHEDAIKSEWEELLHHLQKVRKKSHKSVENTIHFLSNYFFQDCDPQKLAKLSSYPTDGLESINTNQYILTLLENGIHKAIQSKQEYSYQDHQAVKYLFSKISEHIRTRPYQQHFTVEHFLQEMVSSQQIPIKWAAIITKKENRYQVDKWFSLTTDVVNQKPNLEADSLFQLSDILLHRSEKDEEKQIVLPIPYNDRSVLICISEHEAAQVIPLITYSLQVIKKGQDTFENAQEKDQWKDSVILFNEAIMRSQTFNDAVERITAGFVEYLPFERCALFSYSYNEQMGFGLYGHHLDNNAIQNINEDVENLPIIQDNLKFLQIFGKNMNYLQPVYVKDASIGFPQKYVNQFHLKSVVVVPIYTSTASKLLGAAILDQGPNETFKITEETFSALIKFGQSAGEILSKFYHYQLEQQVEKINFSPRELEVLKLMAEGASTSEAASQLNLSEYTVRDYVSAIMQKMNARNRTEAVARALREGMIS